MMFKAALLVSFIPVLRVLAGAVPTAPAPGDTFNEGSTCTVSWTPDTTGEWKTMNIELMSGDNFNMLHLTTVATVDGTDSSNTSFSYTCPSVTPNSAIYFYQFSSPADPTALTWTGRFAIADQSGQTTPPPNATQPDGEAKPWGEGLLTDPSNASPPPSYLTESSQPTGSTAAAPQGGSVSVSTTGAPATAPTVTPASSTQSLTTVLTSVPPTSAPSSSSSSSSSSSTSTTTSGAAGISQSLRARGMQALAALGVTAVIFSTMF